MLEKEVKSVDESKGEFLLNIRNELNNGNFDEAKRIEREHLIPSNIISSIVNTVYDGFIREKKFKLAFTLARKYELPSEKIADAISMEFRHLLSLGKCEEAINWGIKNGLANYEISKAAVKGIEMAIIEGDVKKAVKMKNEYSISPEQIGIWQKGYDNAFNESKYFDAALLSREFGSSERKTQLTASKAFKNAVGTGTFGDIVNVEKEFRLFNDASFGLLGDDESKTVIETFLNFVDICAKNSDGRTLVEVVDGIRILYNFYTNHHLKGLVHMVLKKSIEIHGNLMKSGTVEEAQAIKDQLGLLDEKVPVEMKRQLIEQALESHNSLLKKGDFELAKKIKDEYQIMGVLASRELIDSVQNAAIEYLSTCIRKGEFKKADFVIEDYNIPAPDVKDRATDDLKYLLSSEKFDVAFETLLKFKITIEDEELKDIAVKSFEKCMDKGYYEMAADLGYVFEIRNPNVKKAAKIVWERYMESEDYVKAKMIKRKHKLTRKDTQDYAQKSYNLNMEKNKIDIAKNVRDEYGLSVGIIKWIIEFIKSLLKIFFKTE